MAGAPGDGDLFVAINDVRYMLAGRTGSGDGEISAIASIPAPGGYLPCSRQNSLDLATHHQQGSPGNLHNAIRDYKNRRLVDGRVFESPLAVTPLATTRVAPPEASRQNIEGDVT